MPLAHRVRQFLGALTAKVSPDEQELVDRYLSPLQRRLFRSMPVNDQRHALNVLYRLRDARQTDPHLLQAALLHDAGKAAGSVNIATRVVVVLLNKIHRGLAARLGKADGGFWRRQLYAHAHHERLGAELAAAAGSSRAVVRLIEGHGAIPADDLSRALHQADEES